MTESVLESIEGVKTVRAYCYEDEDYKNDTYLTYIIYFLSLFDSICHKKVFLIIFVAYKTTRQ